MFLIRTEVQEQRVVEKLVTMMKTMKMTRSPRQLCLARIRIRTVLKTSALILF